MSELKFYKKNQLAKTPTIAYNNSACFDLYALNEKEVHINPGEKAIFDIGLGFIIPDNKYIRFAGRSSMNKKGLIVCPGIIDPGYSGPLDVIIWNISNQIQTIEPYAKICQAFYRNRDAISFQEIEESEWLNYCNAATNLRKEKGFGSSNNV